MGCVNKYPYQLQRLKWKTQEWMDQQINKMRTHAKVEGEHLML